MRIPGDVSGGYSGPFVLALNKNGESNQVVNHGRFWGATGSPAALEGDNFFWHGWWRWDAGTYILSDGWGGAHALLWGAGPAQSGNVRNGAGSTLSFGGDYTVNPGEWVYGAVGCDGSYIYTFVNGICVGRVAWSGTRYTNGSSSDGFLIIGGPFDHQTFEGYVAWIAGYDVDKWPLTSSSGLVAPFQPQREPTLYMLKSGSEIEADFVTDYSVRARIFPDLSRSGARGKHWPGVPYNNTLFDGAPGGAGWTASPPVPGVVSLPTCPLGLDSYGASGEVARTPAAVPGGARIYDSFERANQTYAFQETPTLGSTEGGSLGPLVWQQGVSVNAALSGQTSSWGILGGQAVMVGRQPYPVAWVENGQADHWVHVKRSVASWSTKTTGIAFRLVDKDNFWWVGVQSGTGVQIRRVEGGNFTGTVTNRTISASSVDISIRVTGTSAQLYEDGVTNGAAIDVSAAFTSATKVGICAPMDGTVVDGLARWAEFMVEAS